MRRCGDTELRSGVHVTTEGGEVFPSFGYFEWSVLGWLPSRLISAVGASDAEQCPPGS